MAKNIYSLQLLRNGVAYASKTAAYEALESASGLTNVTKKDGVAVLARYIHTEGEGASQVKQIRTLVGYYAEASAMTETSGASSHMTIIDVEGAAADVEELKARLGDGVTTANTVTKQLQDLSGNTSTADSGDTSVAGAKKYADEKVRAALDALDTTTVADENKIVSDVTQTDGKITATAKNVTEVKLAGLSATADTKIAATDTLGDALAKLQGQIDSMDLSAVGAEGSVITSVSEEDGKVSAAATPVKDVKLTGYVKDTTKTGDIAATDDIEDALSKLENKAAAITITNADGSINVTTGTSGTDINVNIKSTEKVIKKDGNGGLYTDLDLVKITSGLPTTIKERYQLLASDDSQIGANIDIYKDSSISKIYLGYSDDTVDEDSGVITSGTTGEPQSLNYVYHKEDGKYEMVHVDVSKFLVESEFASGVTVDATGVVHGVVDSTSEKDGQETPVDFLTVGENGFKVSGIKNEIDRKINALDATVGDTTVATGNHVAVQVVEENGLITAVNVNESNIADADDLAELSGKTVTEIESSNNSISATSAATNGTVKYDIITDASKIQMSGFTAAKSGFTAIAESSSVTQAFKAVEAYVLENERVVSAALNDLETTKVDVITVNGKQSKTPASGDVVASVTINGADIKLDGYTSGSSSSAVVETDTVNQAIGKLENQIKNAVAGGLQQVEAGSGITVSAVENNKQTIDVKLKADAGSGDNDWHNPLKFDETSKGLYFDSLDCGEYN